MNLKPLSISLIALASTTVSFGQVVLNADKNKDTYELINSVLAPKHNAIEVPDESHSDFGPHITTVYDKDLKKDVFKFVIHVTPDNDPSTTKTDRQRIEIKTYGSSPDNLKGTLGEEIEYKWNFKLPKGYQPSTAFTHIHQVKAVGGDEGDPIFTLTVRKGKGKDAAHQLELIYVKNKESGTDKKESIDLSTLEGTWVEVIEKIRVGENGTYSIRIKKVKNNNVLLSYSNENIATIRPNNKFIRPKWGIYRSLSKAESLRDESILFSDFSITEIKP